MDVVIQLVDFGLAKLLADILDETVAGNHDGLLADAHIGLFQTGTPGFTESLTLASLVQATYDGYVRQPVVFGTPGRDPFGRASVHGAGLLFSPTGSVTPNTLTGIFIADALAAGNLLGLGYFPSGISFASPSDDITIVPVVAVPLVGNWGKFVTAQ